MEIKENQVATLQDRIKRDPVFYVEQVLGNPLWKKQEEILEAVRDNREVAIKSCHASGKSYVAGRIVHWWLNGYNDSVVITTAPTFRQVKEVLWREVKGAVAGKGIYPEKSVLDTQINISPQWFALGLSTNKPGQFQGFHSPHMLVLIDEASDIASEIEEAIDGLTPQKIVRIGNPLLNSGRFADSFKLPDVAKMTISAFDTPNLVEGRVVIPGLITSEDVEKMKAYYGEDSDVYRVRVLGEFPLQDTESLFGVDEVAKSIEREVEVLSQWEKKMGVDPARFGDDRTVIVIRQMEKVIHKEHYVSLDTMQTTGHVLRLAKDKGVKAQNINIDEIGVGSGVVDRCKEQGWAVNGVNVGVKAEDTEHYFNLRSEIYARHLKEWIKTGQLTRDDDWYELSNIKYKFSSTGQMKLESKEEMKKRGLPSPDLADALALTFAVTHKRVSYEATKPLKPYYPSIGS